MASLLRESKVRSDARANFVGYLTGFGLCGFFGVAITFTLAAKHAPLNWYDEFGLACAAMSLFCLGVQVGVLPLIAYDAIRTEHENPEE